MTMSLKRVAGAAAIGLGAVAAANRGLRYDGDLQPPLDGDQETFRWRGIDVSYTESGDPADPDLVLLHGPSAAGTAGEWREVFSDLADDYHVVAPDLPGFGLSDRPPLRYSAALYEDFVRDFIAAFDAPNVVASSLSAAYVAAAASEDGSGTGVEIRSLLAVCPTSIAGPDPPKSALRELFRAPLVGTALFNLLVSKPSLQYFNADHGYYDHSALSEEWLDYEWAITHTEGSRFAPASFLAGYLNSPIDLGSALAEFDVPVTLVWGRETEVTPLSDGRDLAEAADARLVVFDRARLLPHVEYPERFSETVRENVVAGAVV